MFEQQQKDHSFRPDRYDVLLMALFGLLYFLNRNPFIGWNDALSFMAEAVQGWSPHTNATSHFLYTNTLHVLVTVFGFLDPAFVGTTFSVLCGLVVIWRVQQMASLFSPMPWARRGAAVALGLAFTFWQQCEGIEVYAFNCLLFAHFFLWSLRDFQEGKRSRWWKVAMVLGLCLLTHIQAILAIPFFIYYLLSGKQLAWTRKLLALCITGGLFSILFILPSIYQTHTLSAVFYEDRFEDDVMGLSLLGLLKGMAKGIGYFLYNFHVFSLPMIWGWVLFLRGRHPLRWPVLLALLPFLAFAVKYSVNDNHVFYLVPYLLLVLPMAMALEKFWGSGRFNPSARWLLWMLFPVLLYAGTTWAFRQTGPGQEYERSKAYKGGVTHLLWPGKAWAKDPLEEYRRLQKEAQLGQEVGDVEWNYKGAADYLGVLGKK